MRRSCRGSCTRWAPRSRVAAIGGRAVRRRQGTAFADGQARRPAAAGKTMLEVDHGAPATAAALSVGGKLLATGGVDRVVRIWRVSNGSLQHELSGHVGQISAIAFSPRGTSLATASTDGIGRIWDIADGQPVSVLSGHANFLDDIAFSPDGEAGRDGELATAPRERGRPRRARRSRRTRATRRPSPRARSARSGLRDRDGQPRRHRANLGRGRPAVAAQSSSISARPSRGSPSRGTGSRLDGDGRRCAGYLIALPHGPAVGVGPRVAARGRRRRPRRPEGGDRRRRRHDHAGGRHHRRAVRPSGGVTSVAFSSDGDARRDREPRSRRPDLGRADRGALLAVLRGHFAVVSDARFSPDGRWVVTAGPTTAGLWDASGAAASSTSSRGTRASCSRSPSPPDGRQIATGGEDGTVRLWPLRDLRRDAGAHRAGRRTARGHGRVADRRGAAALRALTRASGTNRRSCLR